MLRTLIAFVPVAIVVTITPGPATAMIVAFDLVWSSVLAYAVTRARRAFVDGPWARRAERLTVAVLIGLGARLALERR